MTKTKTQNKKVHLTYSLGDFLIRIKNAAKVNKKEVVVPVTKLIKATAEVLQKEGFVDSITETDGFLTVKVSFHKKKPVIMNVQLISKPGLRNYFDIDKLETYKGPATFIITTNKGVLSSKEAIKQRVGGEVIAKVW